MCSDQRDRPRRMQDQECKTVCDKDKGWHFLTIPIYQEKEPKIH
ncbi:BnaCnng20080D [Brassica napus]|uniref:BnaCnng20080D protein n=1 Tax=Brassica napus TaxID=3708 RepID=A0A078IJ81_BRANA|nr:BnaCnng20080D [Brassica napus]